MGISSLTHPAFGDDSKASPFLDVSAATAAERWQHWHERLGGFGCTKFLFGWWVVGALTPVHGKVAALAMLRVRIPSLSAALRSTWPIFGILAVIQQNLGRMARSTSGIHGIGMHWKHVARYFMNPPGISFSFWGGCFFFPWIHPAHTLKDFGVLDMCGELPTCCASFLQDAPPQWGRAPWPWIQGSSWNLVPGPPPRRALGCEMRRHPSAKRCFNSRVRESQGAGRWSKTFLHPIFWRDAVERTHIPSWFVTIVPKLMHFQKWWPYRH